jgi:hypothetical protein
VALALGDVSRGQPSVVGHRRVRPGREQRIDELRIAPLRRAVQRCPPVPLADDDHRGAGPVSVSFGQAQMGRLAERIRSSPLTAPLGWVAFVLAILALIASLRVWTAWQFTVAPPWSDWLTQANAVERVLAGQPLDAPEQLRGPYHMTSVILRGWTYPPASVLVLIPFSWGDAGLVAWLTMNIGLFIGGLAAVLRRELGSIVPWPMAIVLLGLAAFRPFGEGVAAGNVNVALAGLYALCWASDERRGWIAPVAGIAATFKVFPGLMVLWAARAQGWRAIVIGAAVALGLSLVSLPLVGGIDTWRDFGTSLVNAQPPCWSYNTLSIACVFSQMTGITIAKLIGYVFVGVFALGTLFVRDRFWAFVLLGATMLAGVTDMHIHFWVFVYVALVVGLAGAYARRRPAGAGRPAGAEAARIIGP